MTASHERSIPIDRYIPRGRRHHARQDLHQAGRHCLSPEYGDLFILLGNELGHMAGALAAGLRKAS